MVEESTEFTEFTELHLRSPGCMNMGFGAEEWNKTTKMLFDVVHIFYISLAGSSVYSGI